MNQNIQRGNKCSSASQSNLNLLLGPCFPVPPLLPSQGVFSRHRGLQQARTHWLSFCPTPASTTYQSNPLHYREGAWFPHCCHSSHKHHWPQTTNRQNLLPFGNLSPSPSHGERGQIHNLFKEGVEVCLEGCQVRESSKNTHHLLLHPSCQPLGMGVKCPGIDGKNKTAKTSKYKTLISIYKKVQL